MKRLGFFTNTILVLTLMSTPIRAQARRGVWEHVSYGPTMVPSDVFFTTSDEGWLAGSGTIIHTSDAGAHWDSPLPSGFDRRATFHDLRFIDGVHGWVIASAGTGGQLWRTLDGRVWQTVGPVGFEPTDYAFFSAVDGIALVRDTFLRTRDGGVSWTVAGACLTKEDSIAAVPITCAPRRLHFVSPDTGYVAASFTLRDGAPARWVLLRTSDGGATWQSLARQGAGVPEALFFTSADTGYARISDGFVYGSRDRGNSWQRLAPSAAVRLRFADPEVGWALASPLLTYTVNGGVTWDTIPAGVQQSIVAFSLPRRDRAYALTNKGSLLRYRVVPSDSVRDTTSSTLAMPGVDSTSSAEVHKLAAQLLAQPRTAPPPAADPTANASAGSACCGAHPESRRVTADTLLARFRTLAAHHRNLNLMLDGVESVRSVVDRVREVSLRMHELRTTSGFLARIDAFARFSLAVDSLSSMTSLTIQRVPRISLASHGRHVATVSSNGAVTPAPTPNTDVPTPTTPTPQKSVRVRGKKTTATPATKAAGTDSGSTPQRQSQPQPIAADTKAVASPASASATKDTVAKTPPVPSKTPLGGTSPLFSFRRKAPPTPPKPPAPKDASAANARDSSRVGKDTAAAHNNAGQSKTPTKKRDSASTRPP